MAGDEKCNAAAREGLAKFNEKNPNRRIQPMQLEQDVNMRQKRIREAQEGVYLPGKRRDALEAGWYLISMERADNFGFVWIKRILYTSNDTYSYEGVGMNLRGVGVGLIFFLAANMAQAVYTINIDQVGANVVMTGTGSVDTSSMTALTTIGLCATGNGFVSSTALCVGTETTADQFDNVLIPSLSAFSTTMLDGTSSSGPGVYIFGADLYLPENYVSAAPISNSSTYAGTTLAALGLTVGTRSLFVPSGDEIVINIGLAPPVAPATSASIPTLGEYALLGMSFLLAMLGVTAVRRQRG